MEYERQPATDLHPQHNIDPVVRIFLMLGSAPLLAHTETFRQLRIACIRSLLLINHLHPVEHISHHWLRDSPPSKCHGIAYGPLHEDYLVDPTISLSVLLFGPSLVPHRS